MKTKLIFALLFIVSLHYAQSTTVSYPDGPNKLHGFSYTPVKKNPKSPGILILPAWMGIDENAKSSAERLAALGYISFIADIYGEGNYPTDMKSAAEKSNYFKMNVTEYRHRIQLAMQQLVKSGADPTNIVVIGYCFGGTGALEAARSHMPIKGVVSFHGGLGRDTTQPIQPINCKVLVCHGANDFFVPEAQVKSFQNEMKKSEADWQMIYYSGAVHSFTDKAAGNDPLKGAAYNEKAATRSWEHLLQFLKELNS